MIKQSEKRLTHLGNQEYGECGDGYVKLWNFCWNIENTTELNYCCGNLSGKIPKDIGKLVNLRHLNLRNNKLTGEIPPEIFNLKKLEILWLFSNQLTGKIPKEIGNAKKLKNLSLQTNQLTGEIPPEIGNLTELQFLNLYSNQLDGAIPKELGNMKKLQGLEVFNNFLVGDIPREIGNLQELIYFNAYGNLLQKLPDEIGNLEKLEQLFLHHNHLGGHIPKGLGNLKNLTELRLGSNMFNGMIDNHICNLSKLNPKNEWAFNVNNNNLCEPYPECKDNTMDKAIKNIKFQECSEGGEIPESNAFLRMLKNGTSIPIDFGRTANTDSIHEVSSITYDFSISNNNLCPPYPECLTEEDIGYQDTSECICDEGYTEIGGIKNSMKTNRTKPVVKVRKKRGKFFTDNKGRKNIIDDGGLQVILDNEGTGPMLNRGDNVRVSYHGTLEDGTVFSSSIERGEPYYSFIFGMGNVIRGWDEGFKYVRVGGDATFIIPPDMGYGPTGSADGSIPPNATLTFKVNLMEVK